MKKVVFVVLFMFLNEFVSAMDDEYMREQLAYKAAIGEMHQIGKQNQIEDGPHFFLKSAIIWLLEKPYLDIMMYDMLITHSKYFNKSSDLEEQILQHQKEALRTKLDENFLKRRLRCYLNCGDDLSITDMKRPASYDDYYGSIAILMLIEILWPNVYKTDVFYKKATQLISDINI